MNYNTTTLPFNSINEKSMPHIPAISPLDFGKVVQCPRCLAAWVMKNQWKNTNGYGSIPIHTIFSGMNIHLPAILGFTRYQGFDPSPNLLLVSPNRRKNSQHFRGVGGLQTELSSSQWGLGLKCWAYPVHSSDSFYQTHMITSNKKKKTWHVDFPRISPRSVDQTLDLRTARPLKIKQKMNNAQNCHINLP